MIHVYSLAHLTVLSLTPPEVVDVAARTGYRYVSLRLTRVTPDEPLYDLAHDRLLMKETKARLHATGLKVLDVELFRMDPSLEPESFHSGAGGHGRAGCPSDHRPAARSGSRAGHGALCAPLRPRQAAWHLRQPRVSALDRDGQPGGSRQSRAGCRQGQCRHPGRHLALRPLQLEPRGAGQAAREWFRFAHVCDAPKEIPPTTEGIIRTARAERLFPGEGGIDVRGILDRLPPNIPYSLEIPRLTMSKAVGPEEVARLALRVTRSHLEEELLMAAS